MAIILTSSSIVSGLEAQNAQSLMNLKTFAALTAPVTEANMRANVEASQLAGFMTNAGWLQLVGILVALQVDEASLSLAERSVINTLRTVVTPPKQFVCCTTSGAVPANSDGLSSMVGYARSGAPTVYDIEMTLSGTYTCDITSVESAFAPIGLAPAITSANPALFAYSRCITAGDSIYTHLNMTFAADPSGFSYDIVYNYLDADGATVAAYAPAYTLNL